MIKIYPTETDPSNPPSPTAICVDATNATVQHDLDPTSEYSLTFDCPQGFAISHRMMVSCEVEDGSTQFFRVSRITRPITGMKTIYADHVSRDFKRVIIQKPPANSDSTDVLTVAQQCADWSVGELGLPYTITVSGETATVPDDMLAFEVGTATLMDFIAGQESSVCDSCGFDASFDNTTVTLSTPDFDTPTKVLRCGRDIETITNEVDSEEFFNAIAPYSGSYRLPYPGYLAFDDAEGTIVPKSIDLSDYKPVEVTDYRSFCRAARHYQETHSTYSSEVSISLDRVGIEDMGEPKVGEIVRIIAPNIDGTMTAQVSEISYDPLLHRVTGCTVGEPHNFLVDLAKKRNKQYTSIDKPEKDFKITNFSTCIVSNNDNPMVFNETLGSPEWETLQGKSNAGWVYIHMEWEGSLDQSYTVTVSTGNGVYLATKGDYTLDGSGRIVKTDTHPTDWYMNKTITIDKSTDANTHIYDTRLFIYDKNADNKSISIYFTITLKDSAGNTVLTAYPRVMLQKISTVEAYEGTKTLADNVSVVAANYSVDADGYHTPSITGLIVPSRFVCESSTQTMSCRYRVGDIFYIMCSSMDTNANTKGDYTYSHDGCLKQVSKGRQAIDMSNNGFGSNTGWVPQMDAWKCVKAGTATFTRKAYGDNTANTISVTVTE